MDVGPWSKPGANDIVVVDFVSPGLVKLLVNRGNGSFIEPVPTTKLAPPGNTLPIWIRGADLDDS